MNIVDRMPRAGEEQDSGEVLSLMMSAGGDANVVDMSDWPRLEREARRRARAAGCSGARCGAVRRGAARWSAVGRGGARCDAVVRGSPR